MNWRARYESRACSWAMQHFVYAARIGSDESTTARISAVLPASTMQTESVPSIGVRPPRRASHAVRFTVRQAESRQVRRCM